jgi:hypothetical protein
VPDDFDHEARGVNVLLRVREDDRHVRAIVESFADGAIVGIVAESADLVIGLRVPASGWPAAVSAVERRLDELSFDWRPHVACLRP